MEEHKEERKSYAISDEEFSERIAAYNRENPQRSLKENAGRIADKYIAKDGGPPVDAKAEIERAAKLSVLDFERERKAMAAKL